MSALAWRLLNPLQSVCMQEADIVCQPYLQAFRESHNLLDRVPEHQRAIAYMKPTQKANHEQFQRNTNQRDNNSRAAKDYVDKGGCEDGGPLTPWR